MTDKEILDRLIEQNEKMSELQKLATEVTSELVNRVIKLEEQIEKWQQVKK